MKYQKGYIHWAVVILISVMAVSLVGVAWWYEGVDWRANRGVLTHLFNKQINKIVTVTYLPDEGSWVTQFRPIVHFFDTNDSAAYIMDNNHIVPKSIHIDYDNKLLTYLEIYENLHGRSKIVVMVKFDPYRNISVEKMLIGSLDEEYYSTSSPTLDRMLQDRTHNEYALYDYDKDVITIFSLADFKKETINLNFNVTSVYPFVLNGKVIFSARTRIGTLTDKNTYVYDLSSEETAMVIDENIPRKTSVSFEPHACAEDNWRHHELRGDKTVAYSPDEEKIAINNCRNIRIIDLVELSSRLVYDSPSQILGWISNETLLIRRDNGDYAYEYLLYDLNSKNSSQLSENTYYWDYFWELSPDATKLTYGASYINPENNFPEVKSEGTTNLYLINLNNPTNVVELVAKLDMHMPPIWSSDSRFVLFSEVEKRHDTKRCVIYNTQNGSSREIPNVECILWIP